jgi:hypothetical protein
MAVNPSTVSLTASQTQSFSAILANNANTGVTGSLNPLGCRTLHGTALGR